MAVPARSEHSSRAEVLERVSMELDNKVKEQTPRSGPSVVFFKVYLPGAERGPTKNGGLVRPADGCLERDTPGKGAQSAPA